MALDLLFPPRCAVCGRAGYLVCDECTSELPGAAGPRCSVCFTPERLGGLCAFCSIDAPAFTSLRSAFDMREGARQLVLQLKYEGLTSLASPMAEMMFNTHPITQADIVVAVPLHRSRERSRGYNQSTLLAREYARLAGLTSPSRPMRRIRSTRPLARTMHRAERRAIVNGAFQSDARYVEGRRILLIDDVATTGATLGACARSLLDAGAESVACITFARAGSPGENGGADAR